MKTRRIEVIKPITEDETANQINFGCKKSQKSCHYRDRHKVRKNKFKIG